MDSWNGVSSEELAAAFGRKTKKRASVDTSARKQRISIGVLVIGIAMLVVGVVFLIMSLSSASRAADGEFLVAQEKWVMEDAEGVVWQFTEVGKGSLTTNNHLNDYDFIWAIEDGKLLVETDWLYKLENVYEYELDQGSGTLILKEGDEVYRFRAES